MAKVSIIIPVYNVSNYIQKCVESLLSQTFVDIEYIFINDSTPDNSISILKAVIQQYPNRVSQCKIIDHIKNLGQSAARNTGLKNATGEYIIFCDGDDWMEPNMIERLLTEAKKHSADVALCDFNIITPTHTTYYSVPHVHIKESFIRNFITSTWTVVWNILVKRKIIEENNILFREDINFCEDFNFAVKILHISNKIITIRDALYNYNRTNCGSITHNDDHKRMENELSAYLDTVTFLKQQNSFCKYEKEISWRILKCTQDWLLSKNTLDYFLKDFPSGKKYILSCPYTNYKIKILMWTISHHLRIFNNIYLFIRPIIHNVLGHKSTIK